MKAFATKLQGCFLIQPNVFEDDRGYFFESHNKQQFDTTIGSAITFVQDNQSFSSKGVIRAIHFQVGDFAQAKLVRVLNGRVLDVAVDLRKNSPTFGEHIAVELSAENKKQLFIPRGFGHGFVVLSETAEFFYKCDNYYDKPSESGIIYNDPTLAIDWLLPDDQLILSEKDAILPTLDKARL